MDYVSKQIGRTRNCMIVEDKEYNYHNNLRDFMREKSLLDMDMALTSTHAKSFHLISKHFRNPVNKAWSASRSQRTALPESRIYD